MRILIAGANRSVVGGAEAYQHSLVTALHSAGHQAALLHERDAVVGRPRIDDAAESVPAWRASGGSTGNALASIRAWRPNVVYVQGLTSVQLEGALLRQFPCVLFAHSYYGTCATGAKLHTVPSTRACTKVLSPACLALNYARGCGFRHPYKLVRQYRVQRARLAALQHYRVVCVATRHMALEYSRHGVPSDRLRILPYTPPGIVAPENPPPAPEANGHVAYVGRVTRIKGVAWLVRALPVAARNLRRSLNLSILGDGPDLPRVAELAEKHGVNARFLPWVDFAGRNSLLRTVEVVAVPSLWPEPCGLVGIEAGCIGVPSVAYSTGGIPDWLVPGENGELAPADPPTPGGLSAALVRCLRDRRHYERLSRGAWSRARGFTMSRHLDQLLPVLARASA